MLHAAQCTLHNAPYIQVTAHCTLHTAHCTHHTAHSTQHTADLVKKKTPGVWTEHLVVEVHDDSATRVVSRTLDRRFSNNVTSMKNSTQTELNI